MEHAGTQVSQDVALIWQEVSQVMQMLSHLTGKPVLPPVQPAAPADEQQAAGSKLVPKDLRDSSQEIPLSHNPQDLSSVHNFTIHVLHTKQKNVLAIKQQYSITCPKNNKIYFPTNFVPPMMNGAHPINLKINPTNSKSHNAFEFLNKHSQADIICLVETNLHWPNLTHK